MTDDLDAINEAVARKMGLSFHRYDTWRIPDYSRSIAAAWEIVEKIGLAVFVVRRTYKPHWECSIFVDSTKMPIFGYGDAAPLAICKAFLKLP